MSAMAPKDPDLIQRSWPLNEQPMTRLFALGPDALSDAEILSVLLRKGLKDKSADDLAREVLTQAGGVSALFASYGTGPSLLQPEAVARLYAAQELVGRALKEKLTGGNALNSPSAVREYLRLKLQTLPHEVFVALFLSDVEHRNDVDRVAGCGRVTGTVTKMRINNVG